MEKVAHQKPTKHIKDLAFMGFVEVVKNIRTIFKNISFCKQDILQYKPDVLILVDYPGFNLRIADWAKTQNIRVLYYVSPTIWAWKENRVEIVKRACEKMFVILPFEVAVYKKLGYEADYVGHPLLDAIEQEKPNLPTREQFIATNQLDNRPIIAVLPGSRKQEIHLMFSIMLDVVDEFKEYQFVIAGTTNLPKEAYQPALDRNVKVVLLEAMFAGPICGASMNPIRSLAPAIVSGHLEHIWVYLLAPVLGAILAVFAWMGLKEKTNL